MEKTTWEGDWGVLGGEALKDLNKSQGGAVQRTGPTFRSCLAARVTKNHFWEKGGKPLLKEKGESLEGEKVGTGLNEPGGGPTGNPSRFPIKQTYLKKSHWEKEGGDGMNMSLIILAGGKNSCTGSSARYMEGEE